MLSVDQYVPEQTPRQGQEVLGRELHPEEVDRQAVQEETLYGRLLTMPQDFANLCSNMLKEARRQGLKCQGEAETAPLDGDPADQSQ